MPARTIATTTHGRYLIVPAQHASGVLAAFHGYAENAEIMLESMRRIPDADRWTLVSIQGLHRFYNRQNTVVASWMTRQDRELAIEDNAAYVDAVLDAVSGEAGDPRRLVFAGFSQGVAMAYRAAARTRRTCHGLIALAGDVPPDVAGAARPLPPVLIGRGTTDSWYTEAKMNDDLRTLARDRVSVQPVVFEGGHEWGAPFLEAAGRFLVQVSGECL